MRVKTKKQIDTIFFDVDNTLYDSTLQVESARRNAVKAMIEAGLDIGETKALKRLDEIVERAGANYQYHYNELLEELGHGQDPQVIAAGVAAYHSTKTAYLQPFPDTVPTLLHLREQGYKVGVITDGRAVKQWEKLIRLGLQHFFHAVVVSEEIGCRKPDPEIFKKACKEIGAQARKAMMVGDRLERDISGAKKVGMHTVRIKKGKYGKRKPQNEQETPDHSIEEIGEIEKILKKNK